MQIVIDNPVEGAYAIEVKSVAIAPNEGGQKFSVVALGGVTSGTKGARSPTDASPPPSNEVGEGMVKGALNTLSLEPQE